ncbi:unnamed protein product [Bemisia tabaci]|uniref:Uncharacterized protein n=1 Tax=Bemisia tabaci TaxID=7038 RepID=A0A9P0AD77_BEMTA|nr:unnamed protein product [Bemisia tabaci]
MTHNGIGLTLAMNNEEEQSPCSSSKLRALETTDTDKSDPDGHLDSNSNNPVSVENDSDNALKDGTSAETAGDTSPDDQPSSAPQEIKGRLIFKNFF